MGGKFKVLVHPLFLCVVAAAFWLGYGEYILFSICAVLIHETAHAMRARKYGVHAARITLLPFGACVNIECAMLPRKRQISILLAGPAANAIAVVVASSFLWLFPEAFLWIGLFIIANVFTAVLNILPIYPLDGGKIVELFGRRPARVCHVVSNLVFLGLTIWSFIPFNPALAFFAITMLASINAPQKSDYTATIREMLKMN